MGTGHPIWCCRECCKGMGQSVLPLLLIVAGGVAVAMQAPINGALGRTLASPIAAAATSFGVGFVLLVILTVATGSGTVARIGTAPLWQFAGGLLGAFYVWSVASGVASLGVVTAMAALVFGQLAAAVFIDWAGAFGISAQPVSLTRLLAVVMVGGGLVLSRF